MPSPARITLIDDEPAMRQALSSYLSLDGHEVRAFAGLQELQKMLSEFSSAPDLIIADFHLGAGERGIDAIEQLELHFGRPIPAIVLTGDVTAVAAQALQGRELRLLNKPVSGRLLSAAVQELLPTRRELRTAPSTSAG